MSEPDWNAYNSNSTTIYSPAWTVKPLTPIDCSFQSINNVITYAWIVEGWVDHGKLGRALQVAVERHAPWFAGKLMKQVGGNPNMLELHLPPPSQEAGCPFSFSTRAYPDRLLQDVAPHIPAGTPTARVLTSPGRDASSLSSWAGVTDGMKRFLASGAPMLHLHIGECLNGSIISLSISHILTDVAGLALFVKAWQMAINDPETKEIKLAEGDMYDYAKLEKEETPTFAQSFMRRLWRTWFIGRWLFYLSMDRFKHKSCPGIVYIPEALLREWVSSANGDLMGGESVSRNDVLMAWIYKHAIQLYPADRHSAIYMVYTLRSRHPHFPPSTSSNASSTILILNDPPSETSQLAFSSVAEIAIRIRAEVNKLGAIRVEESIREIYFRLGTSNIPEQLPKFPDSQVPAFSNWSKNDLCSLDFSSCLVKKGSESGATIANIPMMLDSPPLLTISRDSFGGHTVHGRLPFGMWKLLEAALERSA